VPQTLVEIESWSDQLGEDEEYGICNKKGNIRNV
jgi:hypothetical protein